MFDKRRQNDNVNDIGNVPTNRCSSIYNSVIQFHPVFKSAKNYFPQTFLKECK